MMTIQDYKNILYDLDAETGILQITLNRPEIKNALGIVLLYELYEAVGRATEDENVKGVILTGARHPEKADPAGEAFSSGGHFDLKEYEALDDETKSLIDLTDLAQKKLCLRFWQMDKPVIAALNGLAIGGGITIPLSCADLIYASEHAWARLPFVRLGIAPELASSYLLPRLIGFQKAKEIIYFGKKMDARNLFKLGIVNEVLPHEKLLPYTRQKMAALIPPAGAWLAVRQTKSVMHGPLVEAVKQALEKENEALTSCFGTTDFFEALSAMKEKREPSFKGA